ncbi:MAG: hypothetical protein ABI462_04310, partial [Ignavibacteria bacterium]
MKDEILVNIENPRALERLYRSNEATFRKDFNVVYPTILGNKIADFWNERLNFENSDVESTKSKTDLLLTIIASLMAGLIAKLPAFFNIDKEYFYKRNIGFIVFPFLIAYFIRKTNLSLQKILFIAFAVLASAVFINLFPPDEKSDTLLLSCIHLPLLLWTFLGFVFIGGELKNYPGRLDFLRYNGDFIVMSTLIGIAGMVMTGLTVGLFKVSNVKMDFYFEWVAVFGLAALPQVSTYIIEKNPR